MDLHKEIKVPSFIKYFAISLVVFYVFLILFFEIHQFLTGWEYVKNGLICPKIPRSAIFEGYPMCYSETEFKRHVIESILRELTFMRGNPVIVLVASVLAFITSLFLIRKQTSR